MHPANFVQCIRQKAVMRGPVVLSAGALEAQLGTTWLSVQGFQANVHHAGASSKATIRCMSLEDSSVLTARQAVSSILHSTQTSALHLASSFDLYL